jgi:Mg2+ and Co2+ transporter CorA
MSDPKNDPARIARLVELGTVSNCASVVCARLADQRADAMIRNMLILSGAAISLPLGLIAELPEINVGGMPGANDVADFWIVALLCGTFGAGQMMYVHRKGRL